MVQQEAREIDARSKEFDQTGGRMRSGRWPCVESWSRRTDGVSFPKMQDNVYACPSIEGPNGFKA